MKRRKPTTNYRSYEAERRQVETAPGLIAPPVRPLAPLPDQSDLFDTGPKLDRRTSDRPQTLLF